VNTGNWDGVKESEIKEWNQKLRKSQRIWNKRVKKIWWNQRIWNKINNYYKNQLINKLLQYSTKVKTWILETQKINKDQHFFGKTFRKEEYSFRYLKEIYLKTLKLTIKRFNGSKLALNFNRMFVHWKYNKTNIIFGNQ
jgi:hypothetical protein